MKNKTAMNSLLEHLVDIENGGYVLGLSPREGSLVKATILSVQKTLKEEYLDKETKQLIDAHCDGQDMHDTSGHSDAIEYLVNTY